MITIEDKNRATDELRVICKTIRDENRQVNNMSKTLEEKKKKVKEILGMLELNEFEYEGVKLTITEVEKSKLDEFQTIQYLKENGLNQYVKTREYFDEAELIIAAQEGLLNLKSLEQFIIHKKEIRLNIK